MKKGKVQLRIFSTASSSLADAASRISLAIASNEETKKTTVSVSRTS